MEVSNLACIKRSCRGVVQTQHRIEGSNSSDYCWRFGMVGLGISEIIWIIS